MAHPRNSRVVTRRTYVRDLPYNKLRELSRLLDPAGNLDWKAMAELMPEYSAAEIGLFQMAYMRPGGSPTMDLLHDWGSRNRTVGNLVDLFKKMNHPVAANIVLPGMEIRIQNPYCYIWTDLGVPDLHRLSVWLVSVRLCFVPFKREGLR
jgi:hypothetical protein